ncbi:MAG: family 1 glycosylhydrolase [Actinomycetota bacterium]|nr:family 1 glycosylhydrolase [Actinomycetota bacterium]
MSGVPAFHEPLIWATGIEDTFIAETGPGKRRLDEYELQQHYELWREDLDLAAAVGFGMIRYGIPWYRVEPQPGIFDWSFTDQVIPYMLERGLEPIIDLMHYGTPLWLDGGFISPDYPQRVTAYAAVFCARYPSVRYYTPFNEPFIAAELCGREARWPPELSGDEGFCAVANGISRGVVRTVEALREQRADSVMVHVEATGVVLTDDPALEERAQLDMDRHLTTLELIQGRVDAAHFLYPYLITSGVTDDDLSWYESNNVSIDVLGLNYYPMLSVERRRADGLVEPVWGGAHYLERLIVEHLARHKVPVFITETSVNEHAASMFSAARPEALYDDSRPDGLRSLWLAEVIESVERMRAAGMPLIGVTWWPLYDLVNWDYREGGGAVEDYLEPMGLYSLVMQDGVLKREPLEVAREFRAFAQP